MCHSDLRTNLNIDTMNPSGFSVTHLALVILNRAVVVQSPFAVQALASKAIWLKPNQNENPQTNNVLHHPHLKPLAWPNNLVSQW